MKTWRESHKIRFSQFDREGRFKLDAWNDLLQEAAATHAEKLGVGMNALAAEGMLWVLAQVKVSISGAPRPGENVEVLTYPSGGRRLFATREFSVSDDDGRRLLCGSSRWVMLKKETLRPVPFQGIAEKLPDNRDMEIFFDFSEKLPLAETSDFSYRIAVRHSMEDINGHLNNAGYIAAAQDGLCAHGIVRNFSGFEIAYHKAVRAPETLELHFSVREKEALFSGFDENNARCVSGALRFG